MMSIIYLAAQLSLLDGQMQTLLGRSAISGLEKD